MNLEKQIEDNINNEMLIVDWKKEENIIQCLIQKRKKLYLFLCAYFTFMLLAIIGSRLFGHTFYNGLLPYFLLMAVAVMPIGIYYDILLPEKIKKSQKKCAVLQKEITKNRSESFIKKNYTAISNLFKKGQ